MLRGTISAWSLNLILACALTPELFAQAPEFLRGDCNTDEAADISDAVFNLNFQFIGGAAPRCLEACNANDDGANDITDAVSLLAFLFLGGTPPPAPFPDCGPDPAPVGLGCLDAEPCSASGSSPVLTELGLPENVPLGDPAPLAFRYADPDGDIATLELRSLREAADRVDRIPAALLKIAGVEGEIRMVLEPHRLAFGPNRFSAVLVDAAGLRSEPVEFTLTVEGRGFGGTAPSVSGFEPLVDAWKRPATLGDEIRPLFRFDHADPDGDIARAVVRIERPGGAVERVETRSAGLSILSGAGLPVEGHVEISLLTLRSDDPLGIYLVELSLIDANGNVSPVATSSVELMEAGGRVPLSIASFAPASGPPGTLVTLAGQGFDAEPRESLLVELAGIPGEVIVVAASSLTFIVPAGAFPDRIRASDGQSRAMSREVFNVPASVTISPVEPWASVGAGIAFRAEVTAAISHDFIWSVNGLAGGSTESGTIDAAGLYQAPTSIPAGGKVIVSVALAADPSVSAATEVEIRPPPSLPGAALILASSGGRVRSMDGGAAIDIPPGALAADTAISVETLLPDELPPPPASERILGAVHFEPSGLVFLSPATVTLPIARYIATGTPLPVRLIDPASSEYVDEDVTASAGPDGTSATFQIAHFSTFAVVETVSIAVLPPPTIASYYPVQGLEGLDVPLAIAGTGLLPDLEVRVRKNGAPTLDITPGALHAVGNQAGILLKVHTIPDLPENSSRTYTIELRRPGAASGATAQFTVLGLDEKIVRDREIWTIEGDTHFRFSQLIVEPGGLVRVTSPEPLLETSHLAIEVTGFVDIVGPIIAAGEPGRPGRSSFCGLTGTQDYSLCGRNFSAATGGQLGFDGRGGHGRTSSCDIWDTLSFDREPFDCAELANYGAHAAECAGEPRHCNRGRTNIPRGVGGYPGTAIGIDLVELLQRAGGCVGGSEPDCVQLIAMLTDLFKDGFELAGGDLVGRRGFGGGSLVFHEGLGWAGAGGGGGGGGLFTLGILQVHGGGGGSGGGRGHGVSILTPGWIGLTGAISADGGSGGNGSDKGPFIFDFLGEIVIDNGVPAIPGGGGGGGSGGTVELTAGVDILAATQTSATASGGAGGSGGVTFIDPSIGRSNIEVTLESGTKGGPGHLNLSSPRPEHRGPATIFDPRSLATEVSYRTLREVKVNGRGLGTRPFDLTVIVRRESEDFDGDGTLDAGEDLNSNGALDLEEKASYAADTSGLFATATIRLESGMNTIYVPGMHEWLQKRILVLPLDQDGDGLSDPDEADLGTDPTRPDTDSDGLIDGVEAVLGSDPLASDTDGDGLSDGREVNTAQSDPTKADTDGDGFQDGAEVILGSDPKVAGSKPTRLPKGTILAQSQPGNFLAVVDPETGDLGFLGQPHGGLGFGIAFDRKKDLYLARLALLATHDPLGGGSTSVGGFGGSVLCLSIADDPASGVLYGVELGPAPDFLPSGQLLTINPVTGAALRVGAGAGRSIHSLAMDPSGKLFAALADTPASDRLVEINPATGAVAKGIGPIGYPAVFGMDFDLSGTLVATSATSAVRGRLLTIDLATGAAQGGPVVERALFNITIPGEAYAIVEIVSAGGVFERVGAAPALHSDGSLVFGGSRRATAEINDPRYFIGRSTPAGVPQILYDNETLCLAGVLNDASHAPMSQRVLLDQAGRIFFVCDGATIELPEEAPEPVCPIDPSYLNRWGTRIYSGSLSGAGITVALESCFVDFPAPHNFELFDPFHQNSDALRFSAGGAGAVAFLSSTCTPIGGSAIARLDASGPEGIADPASGGFSYLDGTNGPVVSPDGLRTVFMAFDAADVAGIYESQPGVTLQKFVDTATPPGFSGVSPWLDVRNDGGIVFIASRWVGVPPKPIAELYFRDPGTGSLDRLISTEAGTRFSGFEFNSIESAAINNTGHVAFLADGRPSFKQGLYVFDLVTRRVRLALDSTALYRGEPLDPSRSIFWEQFGFNDAAQFAVNLRVAGTNPRRVLVRLDP